MTPGDAFRTDLAASLAEPMLRAATDHAGESAVQEMVSRAARTGGMRLEYAGGYLRVEGDGDPHLAFTALFDGMFELMKAMRGLREARRILVDVAAHVINADPSGFLSNRLAELLPPPLRVRLELGARGRVEAAGGSPGEEKDEESDPGDVPRPAIPADPLSSIEEAQPPADSMPPIGDQPREIPVSPSANDFFVACAQVREIPARRAKRLFDSGYRTLQEVAVASPEEIAQRTGWNAEVSRLVRDGAGSRSVTGVPPPLDDEPEARPRARREIEASEVHGPAPPAYALPVYPPPPSGGPGADIPTAAAFDPYKPVIIRPDASGKPLVKTTAPEDVELPDLTSPATSWPGVQRPFPAPAEPRYPGMITRPARHPPIPRRSNASRRGQVAVVAAVVTITFLLLGLSAIFIGLAPGPFEDYPATAAMVYEDRDPTAPGGADLAQYGVASTETRTTFIFHLDAAPAGRARLGVLIDADGDAGTGFSAMGTGAERRIEVSIEGAASHSAISLYDGDDQGNYSSWTTSGEAEVRVSDAGRSVEVQVRRIDPATGSRALFYIQSTGGVDVSDAPHAITRGAVVASFTPTAATVPSSVSTVLGTLRLDAKGSAGVVDVNVRGKGLTPVVPGNTQVQPGTLMSVDVEGVTSASSGTSLEATISLTSPDLAVAHDSFSYHGYARAAPAQVVIDGAFADWDNVTGEMDPKVQNPPPAQSDVTEYKAALAAGGTQVAFYLAVAGRLLDGASVPVRALSTSGGGGGSPVTLPRVSGEDRIGFFLDVDGPSSGLRIGEIGADFLLEVRGREGSPGESNLSQYDLGAPDQWRVLGKFPSALGISAAELGVSYSSLGIPAGAAVRAVPFATVWWGEIDHGEKPVQTLADPRPDPRHWHARHMSSFVQPDLGIGDLDGPEPLSVVAVDLDMDGDYDLAVGATNTGAAHLMLFENSAGIWFGPTEIASGLPNSPHNAIAAADLDRDGDPDLLVGNSEADIHALQNPWNSGAGNPFGGAWPTQIDIQNGGGPNEIRGLALADFDRDGDPDVVSAADAELRIYENPWDAATGDPWTAGNWGPGAGRQIGTFGSQVRDIVTADFNRDGTPDVATQNDAAAVIVWQDNDPDPFDDAWVFNIAADVTGVGRGIAAGDLDNDGDPDLAAGFLTDNSVRVFQNDGSPFAGTWSAGTGATVSTFGPDPSKVVMDDFDRDGWLDLFAGTAESGLAGEVTVWESVHEPFANSAWVRVFNESLGTGPGIDTSVRALATADLDSEGDPDLVFAIAEGGPGGADVFSREDTLVHRNALMRNGTRAGPQLNAVLSLDSGDIDHDGDLDLLATGVADTGGNWGVAYRNPGTPTTTSYGGTWTAQPVSNLAVYDYVAGGLLADLDNDGWLDAVFARHRTDGMDGIWNIRNPGGTGGNPFGGLWPAANPGSDYPGEPGAMVDSRALAVGDLDRDGDLDIVSLANSDTAGAEPWGHVFVWENDGSPFVGAWTAFEIGTVAHVPRAAEVGDLDLDGLPDLAVVSDGDGSDASHNNLHLFRNPGADPFGSAWARNAAGSVAPGTEVATNDLAITDLDRDAWGDIVTTDSTGSVLAWENDGTPFAGPLTAAAIRASGVGTAAANAVAAADMDNDGDVDVVFGTAAGHLVHATNTGAPFAGGWVVSRPIAYGFAVHALVAGDFDTRFNGDEDIGDPEVAVSGSDPGGAGASAPVEILKNVGAMTTQTVSLTAPASMTSGTRDDLLLVRVQHNGILSDLAVEVGEWRFRFYDGSGTALSDVQMKALFDHFALFLDSNVDGAWNPAMDTIELANFSAAAAIGNEAVLTVDELLVGSAARIQAPLFKQYFLVVAADPGVSGTFRAEFDPDGYGNPFNENDQNTSLIGGEPAATVEEGAASQTGNVNIVPETGVSAVPIMSSLILVWLATRGSRARRRKL